MNSENRLQSKVTTLINLMDAQRPGLIQALSSKFTIDQIHEAIPGYKIPQGLLEILLQIRGCEKFERIGLRLSTFIPDHELIAISEIHQTIQGLNECFALYPELDDWKPDMIPFLFDGAGNFYCVRTLENDQSVHIVYHDDAEIWVYQDIEHFLDVNIECFLKNAYFIDEDGFLECNYELRDEIYEAAATKRGIEIDKDEYPCRW
jgi:hypothetical protein